VARVILDTTILVGAERSQRALDNVIADDDDVVISAVTAAELLVGAELANTKRRPARERFVTSVFETIPIEDYDLTVARAHARLLAHAQRSGRARGAHDLIIAATAQARDRVLVTAVSTGFEDLPGVTVRLAR
jgi:tRNA(fMet)-specific endonuclease VapC